MAAKALPSQEVLRQLLEYNPETGALTWKARDLATFHSVRSGKIWNTKYAGKPALSAANSFGYLHGVLDGANLRAHRVIWKWVTGSDPSVIDHINGDPSDNRWCNLRSVSLSENMKNSRLPKHNTTGIIGVGWHNKKQKWLAQIKSQNVCRFLGYFASFDEATAVRKQAEITLGFHQNHGRSQ
jgi:hypothetical protein